MFTVEKLSIFTITYRILTKQLPNDKYRYLSSIFKPYTLYPREKFNNLVKIGTSDNYSSATPAG